MSDWKELPDSTGYWLRCWTETDNTDRVKLAYCEVDTINGNVVVTSDSWSEEELSKDNEDRLYLWRKWDEVKP